METITEDGQKYISCDYLCVGDYGGAGSVGEANIRALQKECEDSFVKHGAYWSKQLWLPNTSHWREVITYIEEQYCLYDEEEHSRVEMEWEWEAFKDYGYKDLLRELPEPVQIVVDEWSIETSFELYRKAMDKENAYPVFEYNGAYLPILRIQDTFCQLVCAQISSEVRSMANLDGTTPILIRADWCDDHGYEDMANALRHWESLE